MIYDTNFDDVLADADAIYQKHKAKKGEGWKDCDIDFLKREKLPEEYEEFWKAESRQEQYKELLDIINVALMLAKRLKL